jgi:hypothetical protein
MRVIATVVAIALGLIVLAGYFVPVQPLLNVRFLLTDWALILAAVAVLIGITNMALVQIEKIRTRQKGAAYGGVLVISLILTAGYGLIVGPDDRVMQALVDAVIVPVESSLMAILAVTLVYASIRLLRRRVDLMSVLFLVAAVLSLTATALLSFNSLMGDFIRQSIGMISSGGARGLLLGIALGTLLTGLRVLFGVDRPYGGN